MDVRNDKPMASPAGKEAMEKKMKQTIREILGKHGGLPVPVDTLADDADLYAAGLSSFASVQVMLGIEDAFDVEFPDNLLNRKSFQSIDAITRAVSGLVGNAEAAE
jgi:acyl carrier protein